MQIFLQALLEILKIAVPALLVFATAYYLFKEFFRNEYNLRAFQLKQNQQDVAVPIKFNALERFALLCERIHLPNVMMRVRTNDWEGLSLQMVHYAVLTSIQQEFEHNLPQQIYVSPDLWEIIRLAKNETAKLATAIYQNLPEGATIDDYHQAIIEIYDNNKLTPLDQAQFAIKKEAALILPN